MRKWLEEMYEAWVEAEEAKKAYYKSMDNVVIAQKVYISKLECYNAKKMAYEKEKQQNMSKEDLQKTLNKYVEAGLVPPDTTLNDIGIWESPEYCLRKLIKSMYGREDYLADNVSVISANDTKDPELPVGPALRVQDNYVNKEFDKAVEQVIFLMKDLAFKQYKEKENK